MIPKIAWFYWDQGLDMPTLRYAAVESFRHHNPGWSIRYLQWTDVLDIEGGTDRARVLRSDMARYRVLAETGGLYLDTDIIFTRPIPEAWLAADVLMSTDDDGTVNSVATIGASPGNPLLRKMVTLAQLRLADERTVLQYQSLGVKLWWTQGSAPKAAAALNLAWKRIPTEAFLPVAWPFVEILWSPAEIALPKEMVGLHWYGGDALSREFEEKIEADGLASVDCPVTRLVRANCPELANV